MKTDWAEHEDSSKCYKCGETKPKTEYDLYESWKTPTDKHRWRSRYCRGRCANNHYDPEPRYAARVI